MSKSVKLEEVSYKDLTEEVEKLLSGETKEMVLSAPGTKIKMDVSLITHPKYSVVYIVTSNHIGAHHDRNVNPAVGARAVAEYIAYNTRRLISTNEELMKADGDTTKYEFSWEFIPADKEEPKDTPNKFHKD